ncbi:hypothetical protein [Streptomyces sp. NPDC059874]
MCTPAFSQAVKELTYMPWVETIRQAFYDQNIKGNHPGRVQEADSRNAK